MLLDSCCHMLHPELSYSANILHSNMLLTVLSTVLHGTKMIKVDAKCFVGKVVAGDKHPDKVCVFCVVCSIVNVTTKVCL